MSIPDGTQKVLDRWFKGSMVERVAIPASVTEICVEAFCNCKHLRKVALAKDSQLESVGERCFYNSGIEEFTFPSALREIGKEAFGNCQNLRIAWVETGCSIDIRKNLDDSALILPAKETMVRNQRLWDLRRLRNVVIPDGV